ncbi:hypothetical protein ACR034_11220 [Limimaricola litoreus]
MDLKNATSTAFGAKPEPSELTDEESAIWEAEFTRLMGEPGPEEEAFFARRRKLGLGMSFDEIGDLVWVGDVEEG